MPKPARFFAVLLAIGLPIPAMAAVLNIDINGARNVPGPDELGPTYVGQGPAGGGTVWNGLTADSRLPDGTDNDNLTVSGSQLADDNGVPTAVSFTVGPVGGDVCCAPPVTDPTDPLALLNDYIFNNSAGNSAGESPWTFTGLGANTTADLYFNVRSGAITIPDQTRADYADNGIFTAAQTWYFKDVPVSNGTVTGTMGGGVGVIWGLSIKTALPFASLEAPVVKSVSPSGNNVSANAPIAIELQDSTKQVDTNSIKLFLNEQSVTPAVSKASNIVNVTYTPPAPWRPGTYGIKLIFADNGKPPLFQTNDTKFTVPGPSVTSTAPVGSGASTNATVKVEITDVNTQVAQNSIQLLVNGQAVTPTITKPAGTNVTTVSYTPASGFVSASTNTVRIVFSDTSTTPVVATNEFSFTVIDYVLAPYVVNIDFNGVRTGDVPGPTYDGVGAGGGGRVWNGIAADSRLADGTDDDNLTLTGNNLTDSLGKATTVSFTVSPMGGDVCCSPPTTDPTSPLALWNDYIFNNSAGNKTTDSPFTVSGLGNVPFVDLYFYRSNAGVSIPGANRGTFNGSGIFTSGNTYFYPRVAVTNGAVSGTFGSATAVIEGMSIVKPLPRPYITAAGPTGGGNRSTDALNIQVQDYVSQLVPNSVQLLINGQAVTPTVSKPAGSSVTTINYLPPGNWPQGSANTATLIFGDSATPSSVQTNSFTFSVINEATAALTVNIDFNGARNVPGPRGPGPTFVGQGAAGGGKVWNGIQAISQLSDGTDDDNITVTGKNLVDSVGGATAVGFTATPVAGDSAGASPTTDPTSSAALFGDYIFVGSAGQVTGLADYTISGLSAFGPVVDIYFYYGANGRFGVPGSTNAPFAGSGIFTAGNTRFYSRVPVTNGSVTGTINIPPGGADSTVVVYGLTVQKSPEQAVSLSIARQGSNVVVSWSGTAVLQSVDDITGKWATVTGATSPYTVNPTGAHKFYRLQQ
jgi:hypothetical protein